MQCQGLAISTGNQCNKQAINGTEYCYQHKNQTIGSFIQSPNLLEGKNIDNDLLDASKNGGLDTKEWSNNKKDWFLDPKYGLTMFTFGKNRIPLYGDISAMMKTSLFCKETWSYLGQVQSLEFLTDDNIEGYSPELLIVWEYINNYYDDINTIPNLARTGNAGKLLYFANYFQIDVKSYFYQEILELSKIGSLKDASKIKDKIDINSKSNLTKNLFGLEYDLIHTYRNYLKEDETKRTTRKFFFSSLEKMLLFDNFYRAVMDYDVVVKYQDIKNSGITGYETRRMIYTGVDTSSPVYQVVVL